MLEQPVHVKMLIGGKWTGGPNIIEVRNPANPDEVVGTAIRGTEADVEHAIAAFLRAMMRKPSCLISCSHWLPDGSLSVLLGRHGAMNPAGSVRCNIKSIAKGYSRAFQSFLDCTTEALGYRRAVQRICSLWAFLLVRST